MKLHFIQQDAWVEPGEYLCWAKQNGYQVSFTKCWLHEELPQKADADLLIVLGGFQCPATTKEECDYFDSAAEQELIRKYVEAGRAVVGVCLGAQLVGEALGAEYGHSPQKEIGPVRARLTPQGKEDPFLRGFSDVFDAGAWHNDMPGLTEDAEILAESDGCPRQIVRYGRYIYGFQTHMEFTHDIIEAGLKEVGGEIRAVGPFIQTAEELLAYDYTDMNRMLSSFLDAMMEDYRKHMPVSVSQMLAKMIAFSEGNIHDIDHFIRVWTYAKVIGELEQLDEETQYLLEIAAITHDIACPLCREKYGNTNGKYQEEEGVPLVEAFLCDTGMNTDQIERVKYLVGHHHTLSGIEGIDYQILIEADYIANALENRYDRKNILNFLNKIVKTAAGEQLIRSVFCL